MTLEGIHIVWTVLLLIAFIGIVIWAWSGRRKHRFEKAARAPLEDEAAPDAETSPTADRSPADLRDRYHG